MSDTTPAKKPSLIERLRQFLDAEDATEPDAPVEVEGTPVEEETAAAIDAAEGATEAEVEGDPATEPGEGEPAAEVEGTPGAAEAGEAAEDESAATIREMAATIETLRNALAAAGVDAPTDEPAEVEAIEADADTLGEDEAVEAFDADYDRREAALAALRED